MNAGDIVRLTSWLGQNIKLVPEIDAQTTLVDVELPPGTIVLILEVLNSHKDEGPSMHSYMRVLTGGKTGYVWAYECEEIR